MQIMVSPYSFSDWSQLLDLLRESFAYMDSRIDPPSSLSKMGIKELQAKAIEETLVIATENHILIGCAYAELRNDCIYIGKLAVAQNYRRKGVARALIATIEQLAHDQNRPFLEVESRIELVEVHAAFISLGFEKVAEATHPGYKRPTEIIMHKRIAQNAI